MSESSSPFLRCRLVADLSGPKTFQQARHIERRKKKKGKTERVYSRLMMVVITLRSLFNCLLIISALSLILVVPSESAPQAFRRDPGHPQWHHGAFQDVKDSVRSDLRRMLHSRAEVYIYVHTIYLYISIFLMFYRMIDPLVEMSYTYLFSTELVNSTALLPYHYKPDQLQLLITFLQPLNV